MSSGRYPSYTKSIATKTQLAAVVPDALFNRPTWSINAGIRVPAARDLTAL